MFSNLDGFKAAATGAATGVAVIIFVVGFFVCAGFVLAQMGKAMGCAV